MLLRLLRLCFGPLLPAEVTRAVTSADPEMLLRWSEGVLRALTLEKVVVLVLTSVRLRT
jgi:hypothetical protein